MGIPWFTIGFLIFSHRNLMVDHSFPNLSIGTWWFIIGFPIFSHRNIIIIVYGWMNDHIIWGVWFLDLLTGPCWPSWPIGGEGGFINPGSALYIYIYVVKPQSIPVFVQFLRRSFKHVAMNCSRFRLRQPEVGVERKPLGAIWLWPVILVPWTAFHLGFLRTILVFAAAAGNIGSCRCAVRGKTAGASGIQVFFSFALPVLIPITLVAERYQAPGEPVYLWSFHVASQWRIRGGKHCNLQQHGYFGP